MGKKKHQTEPNHNSDESTESCDENQNTSKCLHLNKSIDLQRAKKAILKSGYTQDCEECAKNPVLNGLELSNEFEFDNSLWMCLKCGNQGCGRAKNQHALKHYSTPHSDSHSLCVNTTVWSVWCYDCDNEVNVAASKKLLETVEYFRKNCESNQNKYEPRKTTIDDKVIDIIEAGTSAKICKSSSSVLNLPRTCGLSNLGNTCFFNSVMQCLGQTPYLLELLEETSLPGQYFKLPGGKYTSEDKSTLVLDPLDGYLEEWRPLTRFLAETLKTLQSGQNQTFTPRALLSKFTQRMPQFGGGDQHDSHELLRHLLEAVREEDLRRYQIVILDKLGLSKKTDPSLVEGEKKKIVRFYGQQASEFLLPTEQVFRGVLVSTLQCKDCTHTSHRDEFFLDLSLPITEKQIPPMLRRKADEIDDKPSKHQLKKEKRAAKKNKKHKGNRNSQHGEQSTSSLADNGSNDNKSDSESDADVEDNIEENKNVRTVEEQPKGNESGYNSEKAENESPVNNRIGSPDMHVDDSGIPSPAVGMLSVSPHGPASPDYSQSSSDLGGVNMESPSGGHISPNDEINDDYDRPESRLSFVNNKNNDLKVDLEKLSLLNDGDSKKVDTVFKTQALSNKEEACSNIEDEDEKMEEEEDDTDMWISTISPRYQCEEGECSIQSCLNQFTACELMTANNKVSCELCTKRHGGPEKKTVYTNAWKQLLIYNPPAVLILHLKRFQVYHFRPTKVSKNVSFPTLLDIAPFCSKRSQNLPTFEVGQSKVLYSLYGVVEHSGSMHGGHYVAYVKVRPKLEENSYRWQFLPKNQKDSKASEGPKGAQAVPDVPPGKWYYVSDSHVSEVSESKVLTVQAYLLFYERIL